MSTGSNGPGFRLAREGQPLDPAEIVSMPAGELNELISGVAAGHAATAGSEAADDPGWPSLGHESGGGGYRSLAPIRAARIQPDRTYTVTGEVMLGYIEEINELRHRASEAAGYGPTSEPGIIGHTAAVTSLAQRVLPAVPEMSRPELASLYELIHPLLTALHGELDRRSAADKARTAGKGA
jgi:hypothetical protein